MESRREAEVFQTNVEGFIAALAVRGTKDCKRVVKEKREAAQLCRVKQRMSVQALRRLDAAGACLDCQHEMHSSHLPRQGPRAREKGRIEAPITVANILQGVDRAVPSRAYAIEEVLEGLQWTNIIVLIQEGRLAGREATRMDTFQSREARDRSCGPHRPFLAFRKKIRSRCDTVSHPVLETLSSFPLVARAALSQFLQAKYSVKHISSESGSIEIKAAFAGVGGRTLPRL